ncbi:MAG: DUF4910 domain-containing protein [Planctomycetes bacterium]|nr:DUF4910 domain-containing protein [Planctomycetota bacterium]
MQNTKLTAPLFYFLLTLFIFLSFLTAISPAQNRVSILPLETLRAINNEISGELAQDYIRNIAHIKRDQASKEYHLASVWVAEQAKKFGLSDVHIETYPANDDTWYYMQKARGGWDAEFAELWITSPTEEKLTSYAEIPVSLANRSQTSSASGQLIYVGQGTQLSDYEGIDVKDKIVFAEGNGATVAPIAVDQLGAAGVVVINQRFAHDEPDIVSRIRIFTDTPTFVFCLSHRRGEALKDRLLSGEQITVKAEVKATIEPGVYENVIATIPGADLTAEEILLTAHLCHYKPGANDNASGSAAILEIGRTLRRLIDQGKITQPQRTIRFIWIPEMSGSIAYAATHPDIVQRMIAGINFDMVGQYLNDNNSTFFLHCTPHSQPHYVNDVIANLTEFVGFHNVEPLNNISDHFPVLSFSGSRDAFRYRIAGYTGGSDQYIFNDGLLDVPSAFFLIWPDHYYHTSGDKPEICDPTQLKRTSFLGAASVVYLADDSPDLARRLAGEVYTRAKSRIALETKRAFDLINLSSDNDLHDNHKEAINIIHQLYKRELAGLLTVKDYSHRDQAVDEYVDALLQQVAAQKQVSAHDISVFYNVTCRERDLTPQRISLTAAEQKAQTITPVRNPELKGPLSSNFLEDKLNGDNSLPINNMDSRITYEILNFIDGKNTILDIRNAVSAEFEPVPVEWVIEYIKLLSQAGVVI